MSYKRKILQGSASNLVRVLLSTLAALVLPPFLVHRMSAAEYSAWVLILQLSAYVNLLDFGLQAAIGKFVAEHDAAGDHEASHHLVSTSFTMLSAAAVLGAVLILVLAWLLPQIFHQMPVALLHEVRLSLIVVGLSSAWSLPFSTFLSTFIGLQQYAFPTAVVGASRLGSTVALIIVLLMHGSMFELALVLAAFNTATALAQFIGWKKYASTRVGFSFLVFNRGSAVRLARYGGVISIWTLATLVISGLDTVIVGHYDFKNTGFYAIASTATNFMLVVLSSSFSPLLPAISAMQVRTTPTHLGELCIKATRYCALLLCLVGLPMLFGAYPLLTLWVGRNYATRSSLFLEVLVLGNMVRQLGYPYALVVMATGKQHLATIAGITEAAVNIVLSIFLVQRIGAIGVAIGTLAGGFVSLAVHLVLSMHFTRPTVLIRRWRFVQQGLLRPLLSITPSLLLYPFWRNFRVIPANPAPLAIWAIGTAAIAWRAGLSQEERKQLRGLLLGLLHRGPVEQI